MSDGGLIVADAGPLISLDSIGQVALLRAIFSEVVVPTRVVQELEAGQPRPGWDVLSRSPWMRVVSAPPVPPLLHDEGLDPGEEAAIAWALSHAGSRLLLDDQRARHVAADVFELPIIGTAGVLLSARRRGLVGPLAPVRQALIERGTRLDDRLVKRVLEAAGES